MRKIYSLLLLGGLLFFGVGSVWANNTNVTVFYAVTSTFMSDKSATSVKINMAESFDGSKSGDDRYGNWLQQPMWNTGKTITYADVEYQVYCYSWVNKYDGVGKMNFQLYDENDQKWNKNVWENSFWLMNNYRNKMCVHKDDNSFEWIDVYSIGGSWDGWMTHSFIGSGNGSVTINMPATAIGHTFKVTYGETWYGKNADSEKGKDINCTDGNLSSTIDNANGSDGYIWITVAGDYTFSWNATTKVITATYPTSYTRSIASGNYGTLCLPVNATLTSGGTLYTVTSKDASTVTITPTGSTSITAGNPYIIKASAAAQAFTLGNSVYDSEPNVGTASFTGCYVDDTAIDAGDYILYNNEVCLAGTGCIIDANRAYFNLSTSSGDAPSAFRIVEEQNNATDINKVDASKEAVKFFQNGKLFIQKNGVVYDMTGRIVK